MTLELDLSARAHYAEVDPARLERLVWNLLKNAAKFTPAGGVVRVRTIDVGGPGGPRLVTEVADTGIGLAPEDLARVFAPFEQGEERRRAGGLGLGLAIARWAAEAHGGGLTASSAGPGLGTTFRLELPCLTVATETAAADPAPSPSGPLRILLVEDHADTRAALARLLARRGHAVEATPDVASARAAWEGSAFDLLISDVGLPDGSGQDLVRALWAVRRPCGPSRCRATARRRTCDAAPRPASRPT